MHWSGSTISKITPMELPKNITVQQDWYVVDDPLSTITVDYGKAGSNTNYSTVNRNASIPVTGCYWAPVNTLSLNATNGSSNTSGTVSLIGDNADIDLNGKSLKGWMAQVEQRLATMTPNSELEAEWDELKQLGNQYRKLENLCKEKANVWKKLNTIRPPA